MNISEKMISDKLLEIAKFEEEHGECTSSRAMKKYCTDEKYKQRVIAFNRASANTIKNKINK